MGLRALHRLKNYHPSEILREKRKQKRLAAEAQKSIGTSPDASAKIEEETPEKVMMNKALEYLGEMSEGIDNILSRVNGLFSIAEKCSRASTPDEERKEAVKMFAQKRVELDQYSMSKTVQGDLLFSGKFEMKGKLIKAEEAKEIEFKIKALDGKGLGINKSRVDTVAISAKTLAEIEQSKNIVQSIKSQVDNAINDIAKKLQSLAIEQKMDNTSSARGLGSSALLNDLRRRQENLADRTGQTFGLLLNLRV